MRFFFNLKIISKFKINKIIMNLRKKNNKIYNNSKIKMYKKTFKIQKILFFIYRIKNPINLIFKMGKMKVNNKIHKFKMKKIAI